MSENEETETEEVEQTATIGNSVTGEKIKIKATPEDLKKLKELTAMQNEQNKKITDENTKLKKERNEKFEGRYGKVDSTAPLSEEQLTGEKPEQDIVSPDLDPEFWEFTSQSAMFKALQDTANDSQNPQQKQAQQILSKLIKKQHKLGGVYELQGNITELGKKNPDPKKMPRFEKINEE